MKQVTVQYFQSCVGDLILGAFEDRLCLLDYRYRKMRTRLDRRLQNGLGAEFVERPDPVLEQTREQLEDYLEGRRRTFDLPLLMVGSDFQKRVWRALLEIPYGATRSYLGLAEDLGAARAVRAVAAANGANALSIVVPCHRVIGSNGELVGYAGGLAAKQRLLRLEEATGQLSFDLR